MSENIELLITKFLSGTANKKEKAILISWINRSESNKKRFTEFENVFNAVELNSNIDNIDPNRSWKKFNTRIINSKTEKYVNKSIKNKITEINRMEIENTAPRLSIFMLFKIAAIIVVCVGITWQAFNVYHVYKSKKENSAYCEMIIPKGSKSFIQLSDGTKIWINSSTTLKYPQKFSTNQREVIIDGEAFFDIAHDKKRPFTVKTTDINITVLGTKFNVKSYANEGTIETTLVSGSIKVTKSGKDSKMKPLLLEPKQRLTFVKKLGKIYLNEIDLEGNEKSKGNNLEKINSKARAEKIYIDNNIDIEPYIAWKDDKLVFRDERFESLVVKFERWFDVNIIYNGTKLNDFRFTGSFEKESVEQALKALQITTPFEYEIEMNNITIVYN